MQQSIAIPNHHPSEAILFAYGSGALGEAAAVVVATHLSLCRLCRDAARVGEALGGALLEAAAPAPLADDSLPATLARLDAPPPPPAEPVRPRRIDGLAAPAALDPYPIGAWRWLGPGVRSIDLGCRTRRAAGLQLYKIAPGRGLPEHGHGGLELTLVLSGAFSDQTGEYRPGDVQEIDGEVEHGPVAGRDGPCICLAACDGTLQFRGFLLRALRPWFGV